MHQRHATSSTGTPAPEAGQHARDYLVCRLGQREYGIALDHVQELRCHHAVRLGPGGATITAGVDPAGVIAGSVRLGEADVAVGDLGSLLHLPGSRMHASAEIVIIHCGECQAAFAVDSVVDVITLTPDQVVAGAGNGLAAGTGVAGGRDVILLDVARLVSALHPVSLTRLVA